MTYVPHTDGDRAEMLAAIGLERLEDLFRDIPDAARFPALDLPPPCSEPEIDAEMRALAARNADHLVHDCFLGAGTYNHFVPATVDAVLRRGEFYTSYTPYQPEASQGMLQAVSVDDLPTDGHGSLQRQPL
jgi:glycine dehydrogenase subunit 1